MLYLRSIQAQVLAGLPVFNDPELTDHVEIADLYRLLPFPTRDE